MTTDSHGRTQTLLLISKLLDCRDNASPLTLVIDTAEQTCRVLLQEYIQRAKSNRITVIYVSFETLAAPSGVDHFIRGWDGEVSTLASQISKHTVKKDRRNLLIIDTLYPILSNSNINPTSFLPSLISPQTTLVAVHHADQPLPSTSATSHYSPSPFQLLQFLATTIFTIHSLSHLLDQQSARQRSLAAPMFGVHEAEEGALQSLGSCDAQCCVVEMEHRRRSGRATGAQFVIDQNARAGQKARKDTIRLLDEHPAWREVVAQSSGDFASEQTPDQDISFKLSLTEKQRQDREGVVLPYFDAQNGDDGPGEGGRILYEMGVEDDFDEEEDEI